MTDKDDWEIEQGEDPTSKKTTYNEGIADSWVKALTELVTNSYQNYYENWDKLGFEKMKEKPTIDIIANAESQTFTLKDLGTGIAGNKDDLAFLVGDYSQSLPESHTGKGRSSFGRGMSDVVFRTGKGIMTYKNDIICIKDGKCFAAEAHWVQIKDKFGRPKDRSKFHKHPDWNDQSIKSVIGKHGTQVTFGWQTKNEKKPFPGRKEIIDSLSVYYELKNVLNDEKIDVVLWYMDGSSNAKAQRLSFVNYAKTQIGKEIGNIPLAVDPEFDIKIISAKMWKTNAILNQEKGEKRTGGLYIEGEYGQIFDLTLFGQERNYREASAKLVGEVILSEDAKNYMDHQYREHQETVLSRTREGFKQNQIFYQQLKKNLERWFVQILESETEASSTTTTDQFNEAIKKLNEIGKNLLEVKNLEGGEDPTGEVIDDGPPPPPKLPDTIAFTRQNQSIEQGILSRMSLKINCKKIAPGAKVHFRVDGTDKAHYEIKWETTRVPKPNKNDLATIPILIKCNELDAKAEIYAWTKVKNGDNTPEVYSMFNCVEEGDHDPIDEKNGELQFVPSGKNKPIKVEPNVDKRVNLWAHQKLDVGTKIRITFTSEDFQYEPPIVFEQDGNQKIVETPHSFEVKVPDTPLSKNAFRKIPITFTGKGEKLKGKIVADTDDKSITPAECIFEIANPDEPGGGLLSGWEVTDTPYPGYAFYVPKTTKVKINVGVPFVRKILGKNQDEANARCAKLPETQIFVAQTIMDVFLDEIITRMVEERKFDDFDYDTDERGIHEQMILLKQKEMKEHGAVILDLFAPNIRTKTFGGNVHQMNFKKEDIDFKFWDLVRQENVIPPISFNTLSEFKGKSASLSTVHFETKGQTFEVGVYQFEGDKFVCTLHDYDKDGKYKVIMPEINEFKQHFKPPMKIPPGISLDESVFSIVRTIEWVGRSDKRLKHFPLEYDQYQNIPDPPEMNNSNFVIENSSNWLSNDGEQLVQYAKHADVSPNAGNDANNLVCIISKTNIRQMAKMFVRTRVVPAFADYNDIFKRFRDIIAECAECGERAEGVQEILTKIGFHREGKNMVINKLCRNCQ